MILAPQEPFAMFEHFKGYNWVLPLVRYKDVADLLKKLPKSVIERAERKARRRTGVPR